MQLNSKYLLKPQYLLLIMFSPALSPLARTLQQFVFQLKVKMFKSVQISTESSYLELFVMVWPCICELMNWFINIVVNILGQNEVCPVIK